VERTEAKNYDLPSSSLDARPSDAVKRPGRRRNYEARKHRGFKVGLTVGEQLWNAFTEYSKELGEKNLSYAARTILRERLSELGYLKEPIRIRILPQDGEEKGTSSGDSLESEDDRS